MSGLDAPEIQEAYNDVRLDNKETNWLLLSYAKAAGDQLTLTGTGTGGLAELAERFDDGQAQYGYARVEYANDSESRRVKFVLVVWIGKDTRVMRRARVSIESGNVKSALGHHSITVDAEERADIDYEKVVTRLRKAGGADYNGGRG